MGFSSVVSLSCFHSVSHYAGRLRFADTIVHGNSLFSVMGLEFAEIGRHGFNFCRLLKQCTWHLPCAELTFLWTFKVVLCIYVCIHDSCHLLKLTFLQTFKAVLCTCIHDICHLLKLTFLQTFKAVLCTCIHDSCHLLKLTFLQTFKAVLCTCIHDICHVLKLTFLWTFKAVLCTWHLPCAEI